MLTEHETMDSLVGARSVLRIMWRNQAVRPYLLPTMNKASGPSVPLGLHQSSTSSSLSKVFAVLSVLALCMWLLAGHHAGDTRLAMHTVALQDVCPQEPAYNVTEALHGLELQLPSVLHSAKLLSEAVQIDTTVGDNIPDTDDWAEYWDSIFSPFAEWIQTSFPHMHDAASPVRRELVNKHGLLYTWPGSDPTLKPIVLMSHQDVVPVASETLDQWIHPPFSGHIDIENQTIWGRGSVDCKLWLVSTISAVETLVKSDFKPKRTIILSIGHDEESDGKHGAQHLSAELERRFGPGGIGMIVDEGTPLLSSVDPGSYGIPIAVPAVAERGAMNMKIIITSRGGHSSMPPPHTSIGIMSLIIAKLEANPFPDVLGDESSASIRQLQCVRDAPYMPDELRQALLKVEQAERALSDKSTTSCMHHMWPKMNRLHLKEARLDEARTQLMQALDYASRQLLKTTQAIDIVRGGIKVNALPESVLAYVNHRIAPYAKVSTVVQHYKDLLVPLAKQYRFALSIDDDVLVPHTNASTANVQIEKSGLLYDSHEPSPFEGSNADAWRLLSGVIRETWHTDEPRHELRSLDDDHVPKHNMGQYKDSVRVSPSIMFANTDTRWYHNLTSNIFRFGAMTLHPDLTGMSPYLHIHTVNEHASIDSIVKATQFYANMLVAANHEPIERV